MSCITIFGKKNQDEKSILKKNLISYFKRAKKKSQDEAYEMADFAYNNIISASSSNETSFNSYINSKEDPEMYSTGEPTLEEYLAWEEHIKFYNKINKTFSTNTFIASQREFIDLSEGFTAYLFKVLDKKGISPNDLFEEGAITVQDNNIFNSTMNEMLARLKDESNEIDDNSRLLEIIDAIENDKGKFLDAYNNYLDATLGLKINADSIVEEEDIDTDESKQTKDTSFNKVSHEIDQKDGASKAIKMLIAGLPKADINGDIEFNSLGLPKTVRYSDTFNYIQQILVEVPPQIDLYTQTISKHISKKPELKVLLERINFNTEGRYIPPKDPATYAKQQLLRTQFVNQFNKSRNEFTLHQKDEDGNITLKNANIDRVQDIIASDWASNFQENIQNNPNLLDDILIARRKSKSEFLKLIGIKVKDTSIIPDNLVDNIFNFGIKDKSFEKVINLYRPEKNKGVLNRIKEIAAIVAQNQSEIIDFQHYNVEGKLVYGITLNTYLSSMTKGLSYYAGDELALIDNFPHLFDSPYIHNSRWLMEIISGKKIKIGIYDGFKDIARNNGKPTKELKRRDLNIQRLVGVLMEGKYTFLRSADRGIENYFYFDGVREPLIGGIEDATQYLLDHLEDEIATMNETSNVAFFEKNNLDFRVFHIMENGKKVSLLDKFSKSKKEALDKINKLSNIRENKIVQDFVNELINQTIAEESKTLEESGVFDNKNGEYHYIQEVLDKYKNVDSIKTIFALNSLIANIEQTKIFVGDLAFYKSPSDVFKRMSMMNSTKESARIDNEMESFLSTLVHRFESKSGYKRGTSSSAIKTITINDVITTSSQFGENFEKLLIDTFGNDSKKYKKVYDDINESDGFAVMTYDEYRIAKQRYGEWFPSDEKLYQRIANGEKNISSKDMRNITPLKLQYTGKLTNITNLDVPAGRKFAVMPLIPTMLGKDTVLSKLNDEMLSNGVGMAFYTSAAKFGYGEAYDLYKDDNTFNISLDENSYYDMLDYKYMGNQLKINNEPKSKITASTQKRKIQLMNLYLNGELDSSTMSEEELSEIKDMVEEYDTLQSLIVEDGYKIAVDGIVGENQKLIDKNLSIFVDGIIRQGLRQGYTINELSSLEFLKDVPVLEILPHKQKIENLVMAKLANNAISNKRRGDSVAQIPDTGFEIAITNDIASESNKHNLKFYEMSRDGKTLLPMEIMIALPKELEQYVADNFGDKNGTLTDDKLDEFNDLLAEDDARFRESGEHSDISRMVTYVGFRIPNQGPSSSDVAKVKKFFPPYMQGSVAVPKPIVAKTGSDFDIDKLNLYKPYLRKVYENERKHAENFTESFLKRSENSFELVKNIMSAAFPNINPNNYKTENVARGQFISRILLSTEESEHPGIAEIREEFENYIKTTPSKVAYIEYIKGGTENRQQIDNRLLEIETALTLHRVNRRQLLTPLTDTNIRSIVEKIRKLRGEPVIKEDHISDVFKNWKNVDKFVSFLSGLGGVGQTAVHIPSHAMAQKAGLKMRALHNYFGMDSEWIDLGNIDTIDGVNISELLSEIITSFVDVAKDDYILDINAVQSTTNTILMMLRWGMPLDTVFLFINQPVIVEYVKRQELNESVVSERSNGRLEKDKLVQSVLSLFNARENKEKMIYYTEAQIADGNTKFTRKGEIYPKITNKMLEEGIKKGYNAENQLQMLDLFLEYQRQSRIFGKMIRSTSPDTKGFKNLTTLKIQLQEIGEVIESDMFQNYEKMFDGFVGTYHNAKVDYFNLVKDIFLTQKEGIVEEIDNFKEAILGNMVDQERRDVLSNMIDNDLVRYIVGASGKINYRKAFNNLFKGPNSIPKIIKSLKEYHEENEVDNLFFENMLPLINETREGYDNLKPRIKKLTTTEKETMEADLNTFLNEYSDWVESTYGIKNFADSLIVYQMVQTGIANSPYSFIDSINARKYFEFMKGPITKALNGEISVIDYTAMDPEFVPSEFILNHPGEFFRRRDFPFKIQYNRKTKLFTIGSKEGNYRFDQLGRGVRYGLYNTFAEENSESNEFENENPDIADNLNC